MPPKLIFALPPGSEAISGGNLYNERLLGALVLWYLTVGSVRNFAFFLGLSTLCDLAVAYFFARPSVLLLSRNHWMARRKVMGIEPSVVTGGER